MKKSLRKKNLSILAKANDDFLLKIFNQSSLPQSYVWLRKPEIGTVMVQGRIGAVGDQFNLGEITVTRCSLKIKGEIVGHGYSKGRNKEKVKIIALCDALSQTSKIEQVKKYILEPLRIEESKNQKLEKEKAAATKVEFFTMARGDR